MARTKSSASGGAPAKPPTTTGAAISTLHGTWALSYIVAPLLGTRVYEQLGLFALGAVMGGLVALGALPMLMAWY